MEDCHKTPVLIIKTGVFLIRVSLRRVGLLMFFEADRIAAVREMILADTVEQREKALAKILPMQQGDFEAMYIALEGRPMACGTVKDSTVACINIAQMFPRDVAQAINRGNRGGRLIRHVIPREKPADMQWNFRIHGSQPRGFRGHFRFAVVSTGKDQRGHFHMGAEEALKYGIIDEIYQPRTAK